LTNEKQKPVNEKYRNNWDEIFKKKEEKKEEPKLTPCQKHGED
jgi:hypothetical protein